MTNIAALQDINTTLQDFNRAGLQLGSVSSRECLDAPAILATFTAGRTGLVACPWRHYNFNNYADNPHVICLIFICFFFIVLKKSEMRKVCLKRPSKSV